MICTVAGVGVHARPCTTQCVVHAGAYTYNVYGRGRRCTHSAVYDTVCCSGGAAVRGRCGGGRGEGCLANQSDAVSGLGAEIIYSVV